MQKLVQNEDVEQCYAVESKSTNFNSEEEEKALLSSYDLTDSNESSVSHSRLTDVNLIKFQQNPTTTATTTPFRDPCDLYVMRKNVQIDLVQKKKKSD